MLTDQEVVYMPDIIYGRASGKDLALDITMPKSITQELLPVIIFLHGGGWETGDKASMLGKGSSKFFAKNGYFAISVNYRLSDEAIFPAQIHDVKSAIRWVRENAIKYNLNPNRIGIWGHSAGAHLAALAGTSCLVEDLDGENEVYAYTSEVQAVITSAAPVDLLQMGGWHDDVDSSEARLLGGLIQERKEAAAKANPVTYVTPEAPPFLIIHGDKDEIVPYDQAEILYDALPSATLIRVKNGDHDYNNGNIYWAEIYQINLMFFNKHLKGPRESKADVNKRREYMRQQVKYYSRDKT